MTRTGTSGVAAARPPHASVADRGPGWAWAAMAGVAAYAAGIAVAEVAALVVSPRATPVVAVGDTVIEYAPRWAKDLAIALFGVRDKLFLVSLVTVVAITLAAVAGILERGRRGTGSVVTVLVAVVLGAAAATRPGADTLAWLPGLLAGFTAVLLLPPLVRRATDPAAGPGRRAMLLAATVAASAAAGLVAGSAGRRTRGVASSRSALELPPAARSVPAVAPRDTFDVVDGITSFRTPNQRFYRIDTALVVPSLPADEWRLRIHGLVRREREFDLAAVLERDLVEKWATLTCVSNEVGGDLIGNALWLGVPTAQLLAEAEPDPEADMVLSTSVDGFTAGTPLDTLTDDRGSLLAVGMNGEPLPVEHGFPARLVVPGLYGYVSATKWVVDLEVTRFADAEAYWTVRGWAERGPVKLSSRIDRPLGDVAVRPDGTVLVAGVAWAQDVGVRSVELRVDGGAWDPADVADAGTSSTWRQWRWAWLPPGPGRYRIEVRAIDEAGTVQTGQRADPFPSGATGYHTVDVEVPA
jgi:DMSO/TMAO reductase YedYZ molybdopterin-dependent catalytic subunit